MNKFLEQTCQLCKEKFKDGSAIVVCPECGAPYHKECYNEAAGCVFADHHGKEEGGYTPETEGAEKLLICGNCGKKNSTKSELCEFCGRSLNGEEKSITGIFKNQEESYKWGNSQLPGDDVLMNEFVGPNSVYFQKAFKSRRFSFNFAAFLCPVFYYFYRKMYTMGALFFLSFVSLAYAILKQMKLIQAIVLAKIPGTELDFENLRLFLDMLLVKDPELADMLTRTADGIVIIFALLLFLMLCSGIIANKTYKNHVKNGVNKCKLMSIEHCRRLMPTVGGVSMMAALMALGSFLFCVYTIIQCMFGE